MSEKITGDDLIGLGFTPGRAVGLALKLARKALKDTVRVAVMAELQAVLADPASHGEHPRFGELATLLHGQARRRPRSWNAPSLRRTGFGAKGLKRPPPTRCARRFDFPSPSRGR